MQSLTLLNFRRYIYPYNLTLVGHKVKLSLSFYKWSPGNSNDVTTCDIFIVNLVHFFTILFFFLALSTHMVCAHTHKTQKHMYTNTHTNTHTRKNACTRTYTCTHAPLWIINLEHRHTHEHTYTYTYAHIHTQTHKKTDVHLHMQTHSTHAHTHAHTHRQTQTQLNTHTNTHAHTYKHMHTGTRTHTCRFIMQID